MCQSVSNGLDWFRADGVGPAATPAFLVIYAVECYCFFVKFGAHMHFAPLLLAWGTHFVDRRARYRGLFLLCVAAQTYASSASGSFAS